MKGLDVTKDFTFEVVNRNDIRCAIVQKDAAYYFFINNVSVDPFEFQTQSGWTDIRITAVARDFSESKPDFAAEMIGSIGSHKSELQAKCTAKVDEPNVPLPLHIEFEAALAKRYQGFKLDFTKRHLIANNDLEYVDAMVQSAWIGYQLALNSKRWRK